MGTFHTRNFFLITGTLLIYHFVLSFIKKVEPFQNAFIVACNNGWKHYQSSCYKYSNRQSRWTDAEDLCQKDGAHLAKITSRKEQDFVFSLGVHQPFQIWIGLRAQGPSGKFTWADGSPLGNFTFWSAGEPSPGPDVCAEIIRNDSQGQWRTGQCTTRHSSYVCEKGLCNWSVLIQS